MLLQDEKHQLNLEIIILTSMALSLRKGGNLVVLEDVSRNFESCQCSVKNIATTSMSDRVLDRGHVRIWKRVESFGEKIFASR